jgi:hypothetical protein
MRVEFVGLCLEHGMSGRNAADSARLAVTVKFWLGRRRVATPDEIATGAWADSRPSPPTHQQN